MNILNKLTIKHLKMNKKRTIVTIIGVILSTALMVGIGLLFSTLRDNTIKTIIDSDGSQHAIINMDYGKIDIIKNNKKIKSYSYVYPIGYAKLEELKEDINPYISIVTANIEYLDNLKLLEGRLPENENELVIPSHILHNADLKVSDSITVDVGKRYIDEDELSFINEYNEMETIKNTTTKTYLIVGIIERDITETNYDPAYMAFTKEEVSGNNFSRILVNFKNEKDTYKVSENIAKSLGYQNECEKKDNICYSNIEFNDSLLSLSGVSRYSNIMSGTANVIIIILSLVSIACIIVIYNSFAISVMERKKQFGLFASIGATRKQLARTVFFEAFIIALIGIPLGILGGIIGIGTVLIIVNKLLPNVFAFPLTLSIYPLFMIIPIIFMIITVFISALIPSKQASRTSPIVTIRQNDDIKIKGNKLKTSKFVNKIFGIEGVLALKNMKRNKKKYRVTIVSLFISIVLFISFSSITKYGLETATTVSDVPTYDIYVMAYPTSEFEMNNIDLYNNTIKDVINNEDVKSYLNVINPTGLYIKLLSNDFYNDEYISHEANILSNDNYQNLNVNIISDKEYKNYINSLGLKTDKVIVINKESITSYDNGNRKNLELIPYSGKDVSLKVYNFIESYDEETDTWNYDGKETNIVLNDLYYTNKLPKYLDLNSDLSMMSIIISESMAENYHLYDFVTNLNFFTYMSTPKYNHVWPLIEEIVENYSESNIKIYAYNVKEETKLVNNLILVLKILLYGFITLVTLIGVTSVFNTINTSINLRRKEFSMLRSVGLTPKGFNKILYFESLFFGLKSLFYGIPVSILITLLLHYSFGTISTFTHVLIPYESILISIIGVFIIVIISMLYSSSKIKHENILESLRDENI